MSTVVQTVGTEAQAHALQVAAPLVALFMGPSAGHVALLSVVVHMNATGINFLAALLVMVCDTSAAGSTHHT